MNRYVIFDLDGTLFDSMSFWDGVGREFLMEYGITSFPDDFNEKVKSLSITQSCNYFKELYAIDVTVDDIKKGMRELVGKKYRERADFKPNVRATLDTLYANGVKMCIATATYRDLIEEALVRLQATHFFDFILSCEDVGAGKDEPKIFEVALSKLGADKAHTVVVEDSLHAIKSAKSADFKVVAVHDSYQDKHKADIISVADKYLDVIDADTILNI